MEHALKGRESSPADRSQAWLAALRSDGMERKHATARLHELLGPTGRQVTCEQCFELLDRYVELEARGLDADEHVPGMRAHLDGCPACHEEHESLRALVAADGRG